MNIPVIIESPTVTIRDIDMKKVLKDKKNISFNKLKNGNRHKGGKKKK